MKSFPFDDPCTAVLGPSAPDPSRRATLVSYWFGGPKPAPGFVWVVPRQGAAPLPARVSQYNVDKIGGRRLRRVTVDGGEARIYEVLADLLDGSTLGDAVSEPSLADHSLRPRHEYVALPWLLRATGQAAASRARFARGATSAHEEAPSVVRSLAPASLEYLVGPDPEAVLPDLVAAIARDTGLEFTGAGSIRLGAVEAHFLPGADGDGQSHLQVRASGAGLRIQYRAHPEAKRVAIRARQEVRGYVISDVLESRVLEPSEEPTLLDVPGPEAGPFSTTVSVWTASSLDAQLVIAHEHAFHWIRRIEFGMHLMAGSIDLKAPWLERLARSKLRRREELARSLRMVTPSSPVEKSFAGEAPEPWEALFESRKSLGEELTLPEPHGGFFAPANSDEGEGRAELTTWLRKLARSGASELWIVDPHFDTVGLEQLARLDTRIPVRVLHHARARTEESLRALFAQLRTILPEVHVARSQNNFHDRYWFTIGPRGQLVEGFLASNSWASAAQRDPLVLAPLEPATFHRVWEYVADLARDAEELNVSGQADEAPVASAVVAIDPDPAAIRDRLFSALDTHAFAAVWAEAAERLANQRDAAAILERVGDDARLMDELAKVVRTYRDAIAGVRGHRDDREFLGLQALLARDFDSVARNAADVFERGHTPYRPRALRFATPYLAQTREGLRRLVETLDHLVARPLAPDLSARLPTAVASAHVIDALREVSFAGRGVEVAELLVKAQQPGVRGLAIGLLLPILDVRDRDARSLRAGSRAADIDEAGSALDVLEELDATERCVALASVVYDLRVRANRAQGSNHAEQASRVDPTVVRVRRALIVERIVRSWPPGHGALLKRVAALAGGPLPGSWARSNHQELFAPLLERGGCSADALAELYSSQLLDSLRGASTGGGFFYARDVELTEVVVELLAPMRQKVSSTCAAKVTSLVRAASRGRDRPFAKSRFHNDWANGGVVHLWAGAIGALVLGLPDAVPEWSNEAAGWIALARGALGDGDDPSGLVSWCRRLLPPE